MFVLVKNGFFEVGKRWMYNVCVNYVDVCIFMGDGGVDYW